MCQYDVIGKAVLLSNGFKENVANSAHSEFNPLNKLTADFKTVPKQLQSHIDIKSNFEYTLRIYM